MTNVNENDAVNYTREIAALPNTKGYEVDDETQSPTLKNDVIPMVSSVVRKTAIRCRHCGRLATVIFVTTALDKDEKVRAYCIVVCENPGCEAKPATVVDHVIADKEHTEVITNEDFCREQDKDFEYLPRRAKGSSLVRVSCTDRRITIAIMDKGDNEP